MIIATYYFCCYIHPLCEICVSCVSFPPSKVLQCIYIVYVLQMPQNLIAYRYCTFAVHEANLTWGLCSKYCGTALSHTRVRQPAPIPRGLSSWLLPEAGGRRPAGRPPAHIRHILNFAQAQAACCFLRLSTWSEQAADRHSVSHQ